MKKLWMTGTIAAVGLLGMSGRVEAEPAESVTVKVPFAFVTGNQSMPAGRYKIEILTKGKPGVDLVEVLTIRGMDTRSYKSFLTYLAAADAQAPVLSFLQNGNGAVLAAVRANGRSFQVSGVTGGEEARRIEVRDGQTLAEGDVTGGLATMTGE